MKHCLKKSYSDIKLSTPFSSEHVKLLKENGKIIYTGSVDELFNYEYGPLDYRTTYWEYEKLPIKSFQGTQVVNYTSNKEPYTRIAEFKYFDKLHRADEFPYTIISKEFPDEYSIGKPPYYPINNEKNQKLFNKYKWLADQCGNVILGGRLGEYKYYDMDKVLEKAFEDFKSIQSQMECSS